MTWNTQEMVKDHWGVDCYKDTQRMASIKIDGVACVNSAAFIVMMDTINAIVWDPYQIDNRHSKGVNYLMLDGHTQWANEKYPQWFGNTNR
jgi:prepilin-type processing-associated H-X9-DG protein